MPIPLHEALHLWWWLRNAALVVVAIGWLARGPRRWVRIGLAALLFDWLLSVLVMHGPGVAGLYLALLAGGLVGLSYAGLRSWRAPRHVHYSPTSPVVGPAWPEHATRDIERWTGELVAQGFEAAPDVWYAWEVSGINRVSLLRLFRQATEPSWVSLYACGNPKGVARSIHSRLANGTWLETGDRVSDRAMVGDANTIVQRGRPGDPCARLLQIHRDALAALKLAAWPIEDQLAAHRMARDSWIEGLLANGAARIEGSVVALRPLAIVGAIPRLWAGWFA